MLQGSHKIFELWKEDMRDILKINFPMASDSQIDAVLNKCINDHYKEQTVTLKNNHKKKKQTSTLLKLTDYILSKKPIMTAYGVLFQRHADSENPMIEVIMQFMANRKINKDKMFQHMSNPDMYQKYNLLQLLDKLDCNAIYGILTAAASALYNIYVGGSITAQGRSFISSATMFFESFLANNVKFASLNEVCVFIKNVVNERPYRKFNDADIIDRNVTPQEVLMKLAMTIGDFRINSVDMWVPDEDDLDIIWNMVSHLEQEDLNRIYYKNNIYSFFGNKVMTDSLRLILSKLEEPFIDPNKVPDVIKPEMGTLLEIVREYVFYNYQYIDRIERNAMMPKTVAAISDTDSAIVSFDAWYRFVLGKIQDMDLKIGNPRGNTVTESIKRYFYNFETTDYKIWEEEIEDQKEDKYVKFSILNICGFLCGNLINDYMINYTQGSNSFAEGKACRMIMKNEYLFATAMLTNSKKNYASLQQRQEAELINDGEGKIDIKGLPMNKSGVNPAAKAELKDIVLNDILLPKQPDQVAIVTRLAILQKKIYESLRSGSKDYYKPAPIKAKSQYDDPMKIQGIKGAEFWNALRGPELPAIDMNARSTVDIVKMNITPSNMDRIKDSYPEVHERLVALFDNKELFRTGKAIKSIAIPRDVDKAPDWVFEFIDYQTITNDITKLLPVDSVGIRNLGNTRANVTNIVSI